jgi:hypothetical protein
MDKWNRAAMLLIRLLRRSQSMKILWLSGASLTLTWLTATAVAQDSDWHPVTARAASSAAVAPASGNSSGVSLGRPVADSSPNPVANAHGSDGGTITWDSQITRASFDTPAKSPPPSLIRLQSPEVPLPLPPGPSGPEPPIIATSPDAAAGRSGFATGTSTARKTRAGIFASDHGNTDDATEAAPTPTPLAETTTNDCSTGSTSMTCGDLCCGPELCCDPHRLFITAEYLLWWIKSSNVPPLITTGPFGSTGAIGAPGTIVLFGGDIDNETRSGGRFRAGYWFDDDHCWGLDGRVFFLANRSVNFGAGSDQFPVLARPFFEQNTGTESAEIATSPGLATGTVAVNSFSRMWGAELNLRRNIWEGCCLRWDLLAGFRYISLREGISINENLVAAPTAPIFAGDTINVLDQFNTRNQFYGGQLGTVMEFQRNRWTLDFETRIGLGNTHQVVDIRGNQLITTPTGTTSFFQGGLLALPSNIGSFNRDRFAVVPEVGVTLGLQVTPRIKLLVGYTFLYWSNVVRPGNQIDRVIDISQVPNTGLAVPSAGGNHPAALFKSTDFWAQGLSFGMEFKF